MTTDNKALLALADEVERLARRYWTHHKRAVLASHLRAIANQQPSEALDYVDPDDLFLSQGVDDVPCLQVPGRVLVRFIPGSWGRAYDLFSGNTPVAAPKADAGEAGYHVDPDEVFLSRAYPKAEADALDASIQQYSKPVDPQEIAAHLVRYFAYFGVEISSEDMRIACLSLAPLYSAPPRADAYPWLPIETPPKAEAQEAQEYEFEVWQNDDMQAGGSGPAEMVITEAEHYALMYGQDATVEIRYYARRRIDEAVLSAQRAEGV